MSETFLYREAVVLQQQFMYFGIATIALVVFLGSVAANVAPGDSDSMVKAAVDDRIKAVGQVQVGEAPVAAAAAAALSGKEVVQNTCGACHNTGAIGAPKIGTKADWEPRMADGIDGLVKNAINGKGAMPPNGGGNFSEAEIKAAIETMLAESGF